MRTAGNAAHNDASTKRRRLAFSFLPLDEVVASIAVLVVVSGSDGRAETLLEPAK